jgi:hypothetical protein
LTWTKFTVLLILNWSFSRHETRHEGVEVVLSSFGTSCGLEEIVAPRIAGLLDVQATVTGL